MGKVKAVIASGGTVGGVNKCHTVGEGVDERPTALGGDRRQQLNLSKNVVTTEIVGTPTKRRSAFFFWAEVAY